MNIYDLKAYQEKVAKFSVSPYAEAITTLAGLSAQVVGIATRLASSYASLRGTVQLLSTNEDNEIVDETTEARETIARSAVVSAWTSIGSAVERLISLRREFTGEGVTREIPAYPSDYTSRNHKASVVIPALYANSESGDLTEAGCTIVLPKNYVDASGANGANGYIPLALIPHSPLVEKLFNSNPEPNKLYATGTNLSFDRPCMLGSTRIIAAVCSVEDSEVTALYVLRVGNNGNQGDSFHWAKYSGTLPTLSRGQYYYFTTTTGFPSSSYGSAGSVTGGSPIGYASCAGPKVMSQTVEIDFPRNTEDTASFDPMDPKEVFAQTYQAASAILELMEEMGYPSGLSESDRSMLTS